MKCLPLILFFISSTLIAQPLSSDYDLAASTFVPLAGVRAPTSFITFQDRLFIGAGLDDVRPGIFRAEGLGADQATAVVYAPQFDTTAFYIEDNHLKAVASRVFSPLAKDWTAHAGQIDLEAGVILSTSPLPIDPDCYDDQHGCGLTAVLRLADGHFLTVTKQQLARINTWRIIAGTWDRERDFTVGVRRRSNQIVDVKQKDNQFFFLLQDRWQLARASREDILNKYASYMELELALDFSDIKRRLKQRTKAVGLDQVLMAFDWDPEGNLWLLLSAKGFVLEIDNQPTRQPQWLKIPRKSKE